MSYFLIEKFKDKSLKVKTIYKTKIHAKKI